MSEWGRVEELKPCLPPSSPPPIIVQFQKISILSPQKGLEFPGREGGGVFYETKKIKEMYEAKQEFPEGWHILPLTTILS